MKTQPTPPLAAVDQPRLVRLSWFRKVTHQNLGECIINMECLAMQLRNADPTSIFVEHDGDIKEVSRAMISETNDTWYRGL
jgi:hypothetical protein